MHISLITVHFLQDLGHDVIRINEIQPSNSSDKTIVETAKKERRVIIMQDLDFAQKSRPARHRSRSGEAGGASPMSLWMRPTVNCEPLAQTWYAIAEFYELYTRIITVAI